MTRRQILTLVATTFVAVSVLGSGRPDSAPTLLARADLSPSQQQSQLQPVVKTSVVRVTPVSPPPRSSGGGGKCSLEYIGKAESGNNYTAQNKRSTASGKYQYLDSTWNGYGGYQRAKDAPPEIQEERARSDFARRGGSMWAVCGFQR